MSLNKKSKTCALNRKKQNLILYNNNVQGFKALYDVEEAEINEGVDLRDSSNSVAISVLRPPGHNEINDHVYKKIRRFGIATSNHIDLRHSKFVHKETKIRINGLLTNTRIVIPSGVKIVIEGGHNNVCLCEDSQCGCRHHRRKRRKQTCIKTPCAGIYDETTAHPTIVLTGMNLFGTMHVYVDKTCNISIF